ncbi:MAG: ATP-dependent sacrificial sulfur transferase LarE [Phormidesmis sp. RL_2_1]|nr:ATP-dependent sacrificial sulfur transferase LarE [Phormidesmis sp. RL_2_1]
MSSKLNTPSKLIQLQAIFRKMDRALIAYSGGIDSTLVAKVAFDVLGDRALAVTANSPSLMPEDFADAKAQAAEMGIAHEVVETHEMENEQYTHNPVNRCYFCKSELYDTLRPLADKLGYPYLVDGLNADDLQDYRPGIAAAKERGVRSPLAEVGITKLDVREMSKQLALPWWDKPSQPCLSSRFPYGELITTEKLHRVGRAERHMQNLGYRNLRVRSDGETARIELMPEDIQSFMMQVDLPALVETFQRLGFVYVTLDLEGYKSGKLNRVLSQVGA